MIRPLLFAGAVLAFTVDTAQAEQKAVYRCGQTYQDSPCPGGKTVDVADERTEAQRKARVDAAKQEEKFAAQLQKERVERERQQRPAGAANLGVSIKPAPHAEKPHPMKAKKKKTEKATLKPLPPAKPAKTAQPTG